MTVVRVLVTAVFIRGLHNKQMVDQARQFLAENRQSIVGIFKRYANIGGVDGANLRGDLEGLVKSLTALITATDFLEVCFDVHLLFEVTFADFSTYIVRG